MNKRLSFLFCSLAAILMVSCDENSSTTTVQPGSENGDTCKTGTKCGDKCVSLADMHWSGCGICASGYEDKDKDAANGCEAPSSSGNECSGNQVKCGTSCVVLADKNWSQCNVCAPNYEDKDKNPSNGCESPKDSGCTAPKVECNDGCVDLSAMHWSSCNTCLDGYEDKDGKRDNGCESIVIECAAGQVECSGECTNLSEKHWASCNVCMQGYIDEDKNPANGCESQEVISGCDSGKVPCGEGGESGESDVECVDLAAKHWSACGVCISGYADKDYNQDNGCESVECTNGQVECNGTCVNLAQKHWSSCNTCRGGYEDTDKNPQNGCETQTMNIGECYLPSDCNQLPHVSSTNCAGNVCEILACANGYADCDGDSATGCEVASASDYYHCGASGMCQGANAGKQCKLGEQCANGTCKPVPEIIGCSDGTREGFIDLIRFNNLAACGGAWTIPGIHHNVPACGRQSGNTGVNHDGNGCNLEDLCAEGWHVCLGRGDVMTRSDYGCDGILDGVNQNEPALFITRTSSRGSLNCDPDTVGVPLNMNDIFGCGNFGCYATGADCDPLKLSGHNLCQALRKNCGCRKDSSGEIICNTSSECNGNGIGHPLDYFAILNNKTYTPAWDCTSDLPDSSDGWQEARDIVKSQPDSQGGVMCCKDQCQADADCGVGLICRYHVCVECIRKEDGSYEGCPAGKTCSQHHTCE